MFRAAVVLSLASVLLAALALISCLSVEDKREIRVMPRFAWVLVILLVPLLGAGGWFLAGRPARPVGKPGSPWRAATGFPEPRRPQAPDDDPEFLRSLGERATGDGGQGTTSEEDELLRRWEEDLKRREDDHRGGKDDPPDGPAKPEEERRRRDGTES
ncbi:PLDc N-terminal domain-containing protein [Natronosporangium hydrolyticum]|uniref:PLDc N-terminal domain-containing protein n=1 Tax=Natronosporangium hydrolyticum TaxID=2811111 RepID=A0A895YGK8_9ACTN|nr:PLDc N-terminal domain-containing protein [Natronosporangium hydrolyticum]QSB13666.1 PLDc N-terminal domain-containing protein [Natronosporangium hydrolyticum]